jgi:dipeptidyl aminopeptidase/acylaminoacyl peptidase
MNSADRLTMLLAGLGLAVACPALARPLHVFEDVAISPDGKYVASIEGDQTPSGAVDIETVAIRPTAGGPAVPVPLPCGAKPTCTPSSLAWAADGRRLGFILRSPGSHAHAIYTVGKDGGPPELRASFNGTLVSLKYGNLERMAVLATAGAEKEVGAVEAGAPDVGVLGGDVHEQRIATVTPDGLFTFVSPPNLFVYEYDWRPGGRGFVGTASPGDGDNNWWTAKLYAFDSGDINGRVIYTPASPQQQLAEPKVSPDGNDVSFIAGIMSDFGATGGEAYILPIDEAGAKPRNITPGLRATVRSLAWDCERDGFLTASILAGDQTRIAQISETGGSPDKTLFSGQVALEGHDTALDTACGPGVTATVRQGFTTPPEIAVGAVGDWHNLTSANAGFTAPATVKNVTWQNDGFSEQGYLLLPSPVPAGKLGMITEVHGGPAWANQPHFIGDGFSRRLLQAGYALFLPNPRGSFGEGEAYTRANVKDFGYGDLRDILAGIDATEKAAPIDEQKLGVMGWSYGGYMTMWTVTQTTRFKAAVAGAGISDWQSYYGENGIDGWMIPYFGASVYADPAVYAKSSPMSFITHVKTPTLEVVGEADIECPAPQTQEFWHALTDLGVPTEGVIYPGEGHAMHDPKHVADFGNRLIAWFDKYLK